MVTTDAQKRTDALFERFQEPMPERVIKQRSDGMDYFNWIYTYDCLTEDFGREGIGWNLVPTTVLASPTGIAMVGTLEVNLPNGEVLRIIDAADKQNATSARQQLLKRAAAQLGPRYGLDLYRKDEDDDHPRRGGGSNQRREFKGGSGRSSYSQDGDVRMISDAQFNWLTKPAPQGFGQDPIEMRRLTMQEATDLISDLKAEREASGGGGRGRGSGGSRRSSDADLPVGR